MSDLKPCPFCGRDPKVFLSVTRFDNENKTFVCCQNDDCWLDSRTTSTVRWNSRPIEDALNARVAELEAELRRKDGEE